MVSSVGCTDPTVALKHSVQLAQTRRTQVAHDQRDAAISVESMTVDDSTEVADLLCVTPPRFELEGEAPTDAGEPAALLAAKSAPPAIRAQLIERAALIETLSAEPSRKLTLLSAPAGWGKTTLLAQWVSGADDRRRRGWVSLDASDNDPARFWACAIAALRKASPVVAARASELIKMGADLRQVVLPTLLDELAAIDYQIALVLDDYHLVENRTVHEQVGYVVERRPQTFRLVIATRSDPLLPLARLRARGELLELRAEELRFQAGEAADLLEGVLGFKLTDAQVQLLSRRTEGWAAGLYLAGLSLAGRTDAAAFIQDFAGDNRHIVDYLIAEVLDGQPPHIRSFLLRTSLLGRLSGALCDAVLQTSGSSAVLETIERDNLFLLPLDVSRCWYRYHQLFADLLRSELRCSEPDLIPSLHQRASAWFAGEDLIDEAVHHVVAAGDMCAAAELIADSWATAFNLGRLSTVSGWLDVLPPETVSGNPRLSLARAWVALDSGRLDDAGCWIEAVQPARPDCTTDFDNIDAKVVVLRAVHRFRSGDLGAALDTARRAISLDLGDAPVGGPAAYCVYGAALYFSGDTDDAQDAFRVAVSLAEKVGNLVAHRYALGYLAMISAHQGQLAAAEELIRRATGSSRELAHEEHFVDMMVSLATATILDMRGDAAAAAEAADMAVGLARRGAGILEVANALLARAEIVGHLGERLQRQASRNEAAMLLRHCTDAGIVASTFTAAQRGTEVAVSAPNQGDTVAEELTAKEHEVLGLMATQLSRREIGQRLYVSLNTVKTHQRALYRKLGVENRTAAVTRARELGLR